MLKFLKYSYKFAIFPQINRHKKKKKNKDDDKFCFVTHKFGKWVKTEKKR